MKILYPTQSSWKPPKISDLPSWKDAKRVAIDLETKDPLLRKLGPGIRRGGKIIGVSFAIEGQRAYYLPFGHLRGNLDEYTVKRYLNDQLRNSKVEMVGANLSYDLDYLLEWGLDVFNVTRWLDIQVAEPLLDENQMKYSLDDVARRHGIPGKDESLLESVAMEWGLNPKSEMYQLPSEFVGPYAEQDVLLPLSLFSKQEKLVEKQGLTDIFNLETELLPMLVGMRRKGVRIDHDRIEEIQKWTIEQERGILGRMKTRTGIQVDVGGCMKTGPLVKMLEEDGVKIPKSKTGKPSIVAEWLESIDSPLGMMIREARKFSKNREFLSSWQEHSVGDRVHCTLNQLKSIRADGEKIGTVTGRISSSNFNLQQIPGRDPWLGPLLRSCFLPDEGSRWASCDFAAQEPRMTIHYAALQGLKGAAEAVDYYLDDPNADHHGVMATMIWGSGFTKIQRKRAKELFLGLAYGMGQAKLCRKLGLPTEWVWSERWNRQMEIAGEEGQRILSEFNDKVPFIKKLSYRVKKAADKRGYIRTLKGRHCHFDFDKVEEKREFTYKALNKLIQGSCADMTKLALMNCMKAGHNVQLQVHDELCASVRDEKEAKEIGRIMEECVTLELPMAVDVEMGESWGDSMECKADLRPGVNWMKNYGQ